MASLTFQESYQLQCTLNRTWLIRAKIKELIAYFQTERLGYILKSLTKTQGATESLNNEILTVNLAFVILGPEFKVCLPVVIIEEIWIIKISPQRKEFEGLCKGNDSISPCIVKGIIKINKYVVVSFHAAKIIKKVHSS